MRHLASLNLGVFLRLVALDQSCLTCTHLIFAALNNTVPLDSHITFSDHDVNASQRALGRLRGLYRFRALLPVSTKLLLKHPFVLAKLYYCYPAYGKSISTGDIDRIQKIQNSDINLRLSLCLLSGVLPTCSQWKWCIGV
ncbi:hypothetical protein J6590_055210 [Homalodisca vitripennis]|nr:hypothetical protein J6590_096537 [Homalodisca vitripennis]KAG8291642.1 hypothetical protein J6590_055210 [Homalodisca vitripennis]